MLPETTTVIGPASTYVPLKEVSQPRERKGSNCCRTTGPDGGGAVVFDVNEQGKDTVGASIEDAVAGNISEFCLWILVREDVDQRINIKTVQCTVGRQRSGVVTNQQVAVDEVHICFHTGAAGNQGVVGGYFPP